MNKHLLLPLLLTLAQHTHAQSFAGISTGRHAGVTGVYENPATIATGRMRSDFTLLSASFYAGNDRATTTLGDLRKEGISSFPGSLKDKLEGSDARVFTQWELRGPSLMFRTGARSALALTTRIRTLHNTAHLDTRLLQAIEGDTDPSGLPYRFGNNPPATIDGSMLAEAGISYARTLVQRNRHQLNAGFTYRRIQGSSHATLTSNLKGTLDANPQKQLVLANTSGQLSLAATPGWQDPVNPTDVIDLAQQLFSSPNKGWGLDAGITYRLLARSSDSSRRNFAPHKLQVGLALTDLGRVNIMDSEGSSYGVAINGDQQLSLDALSNSGIADLHAFANAHPAFFSRRPSAGEQRLQLPSTLRMSIDYQVRGKLYVNMATQVPMGSAGSSPRSNRLPSMLTLTPRFEVKGLGLYLPVSHNNLTGTNMGASVRLGPLFIGSGTILSALFGNTKQIDAFAGLRFGGVAR